MNSGDNYTVNMPEVLKPSDIS